MNLLEKVKKEIVKEVNKALGKNLIQVSDLVYPPNKDMGDLSLPCFSIAKESGKNPASVAGGLVGKVKVGYFVAGIKTAGPYLNFTLKTEKFSESLIGEIIDKKNAYGTNEKGKKKKVMVEFSNANTHKEYHVGHLRNLCYGDGVSRILSANGYDSIPVSYINDFGIHVAKTLWAYLNFRKDETPEENKGYFLGQTYVMASKKIKEDQSAKPLVEFIMKKVEAREGREYKLWQETREWSIEQFSKIYKEMGIDFKNVFYESEFIDKGRRMVEDLRLKGIFEKSQGAVIANLEEYKLGVLVILRSDGTATYPVADIPLAIHKFEKFNLNESIYVVDGRQALYFKQLFKILELIGYGQKMIHLGYEVVKLPSGMMSSRSGNVITYEDLRDKLFAKAKEETKKRHSDWSEDKINKVAEKIIIGAIKFEMLKVGAMQTITFDIEKALDFSGYTAAYLQYTSARINSIIKKSKVKPESIKANFKNLKENKEHGLLVKMSKYPEIIERAADNYDVSEITKYLFELAQQLNDYYHSIQILKESEEIRDARLVLINAANQIIKNGFSLLGIENIKEM